MELSRFQAEFESIRSGSCLIPPSDRAFQKHSPNGGGCTIGVETTAPLKPTGEILHSGGVQTTGVFVGMEQDEVKLGDSGSAVTMPVATQQKPRSP